MCLCLSVCECPALPQRQSAMPSSTVQVPLVTSDWLVAPLYCISLFLPLLHSSLILALLCLFIWASDMRLESLVFTVVYFDRWKSCIRCTCNMLGHKLLLGVLALWGSDQSLGNSEVRERRSQVNVDGSSWGLFPSLNGVHVPLFSLSSKVCAVCPTFVPGAQWPHQANHGQ